MNKLDFLISIFSQILKRSPKKIIIGLENLNEEDKNHHIFKYRIKT
jgi:hypothetical protein